MKVLSDIPFRRLLAESIAVVASILLAFWIDASWDNFQETRRLDETLSTVLKELNHSKEKLEFQRTVAVTRREAILALFDLANQERPEVGGPALDKLVAHLGWAPTEEIFGTSGIQALIYGGELALVRSDELRADLADWPRRIQQVSTQRSEASQTNIEVWAPYLRTHGDVAQIEGFNTHWPGHPDRAVEPFPIQPRELMDHAVILRDSVFRNILVELWVVTIDTIAVYDSAGEWIENSVRLVEDEIGH